MAVEIAITRKDEDEGRPEEQAQCLRGRLTRLFGQPGPASAVFASPDEIASTGDTLRNVSLSAVRAFEAAGQELNLSPSAVSHAVMNLEEALGTALFERSGRIVRLSPDGETLMRHVGVEKSGSGGTTMRGLNPATGKPSSPAPCRRSKRDHDASHQAG